MGAQFMEDNRQHSASELQKKLKEIGINLASVRLSKGISLAEVASKTLISQRLLKAIEAGNLEELPEPVYIQALINKFADAIDAPELKLNFQPTVTGHNNTASTSSSKKKNQIIERKHPIDLQLRSLHLYLLYIFLVGISVKGITALVEPPVAIEPVTEKESADKDFNQDLVPDSVPVQQSKKSKSVPQLVSQPANANVVTVGIDLEERCWLKVLVDGKIAFEGILPKGTKRSWTGKEQVTIRAGNAGGVGITFNNGQRKVLGERGKVEEITYTLN